MKFKIENKTLLKVNRSCSKEVIVPNNIKIIGRFAFYYCTTLSEVIISNPTIKIDINAFYKTKMFNLINKI